MVLEFPLLLLSAVLLTASLGVFADALRKERKDRLETARISALISLAFLLLHIGNDWRSRGFFSMASMGEFLVLLSGIQLAGALLIDRLSGLRILPFLTGLAVIPNLAIALLALRAQASGSPSTFDSIHKAAFLAGYGILQISCVCIFAHRHLDALLRSRRVSWFFELTPSLEGIRRMATLSFLAGYGSITVGILAGYLSARSRLGPGVSWRFDPTILLVTASWLCYSAALIVGQARGFRSRSFAAIQALSFSLLISTLVTTIFWSPIHRAA